MVLQRVRVPQPPRPEGYRALARAGGVGGGCKGAERDNTKQRGRG